MFERPHHRRIALVLQSLDGPLLRASHCLFGGGTAIALRHGEYRESVDIDFLVSDIGGFRSLRHLLTGAQGIGSLVRADAQPLKQAGELRADQYGVRTTPMVDRQAITRIHARPGWLERCMEAMAVSVPKAQLWQRIRELRRVLPGR